MARKKSKVDPLDKEIESAWYRLAFGVQVNIMNIGAIFKESREAVNNGKTVDEAVTAAREKYREN
jgi:hypothetical protein